MAETEEQEMIARFKKAGEVVKDLPEAVQAVAFQRALDELSGVDPSQSQPRKTNASRRQSRNSARSAKPGGGKAGRAEQLETQLDSTQYPEIDDTQSVLLNALGVLKAAKDRASIDGLTPGEIARVLTNKFRVRTSDAAVRMALGDARKLVDRQSEGRGYIYRIMAGGEKHLENPRPQTSERKTPKSRAKKKQSTRVSGKGSGPQRDKKPKTARGRPGPKQILGVLLDDGLFDTPQTIGSVISYIKDNRGYLFKPTDLSPALSRLLREDRLTRSRNKENQYEYTRKG